MPRHVINMFSELLGFRGSGEGLWAGLGACLISRHWCWKEGRPPQPSCGVLGGAHGEEASGGHRICCPHLPPLLQEVCPQGAGCRALDAVQGVSVPGL